MGLGSQNGQTLLGASKMKEQMKPALLKCNIQCQSLPHSCLEPRALEGVGYMPKTPKKLNPEYSKLCRDTVTPIPAKIPQSLQ